MVNIERQTKLELCHYIKLQSFGKSISVGFVYVMKVINKDKAIKIGNLGLTQDIGGVVFCGNIGMDRFHSPLHTRKM